MRNEAGNRETFEQLIQVISHTKVDFQQQIILKCQITLSVNSLMILQWVVLSRGHTVHLLHHNMYLLNARGARQSRGSCKNVNKEGGRYRGKGCHSEAAQESPSQDPLQKHKVTPRPPGPERSNTSAWTPAQQLPFQLLRSVTSLWHLAPGLTGSQTISCVSPRFFLKISHHSTPQPRS